MKVRAGMLAAVAAITVPSPAAAELLGHKMKPSDAQAPTRSWGVPPAPPAYGSPAAPRPASSAIPATPRPPSMPTPGGFKPYEPYRGSSVYGAPRPVAPGAKPCETSVYTNACR